MISSADQSDCRDLALDLRDAIKDAGLRAELVSTLGEQIDPGILVKGTPSDQIFQSLLTALSDAGFVYRVTNLDGARLLAISIGRKT